jgi:predicted RND superfamily exporter protein
MKKIIQYVLIAILFLFGFLTLFLSSSVIFDWFGIRAKEGNYVLFVVWANFVSSILYLLAAVGLIRLKKWATHLLGVSVAILVMAFLGLLMHINNGGIYETKTIGAMIFRTFVTLVFTITSHYIIKKNNTHNIK